MLRLEAVPVQRRRVRRRRRRPRALVPAADRLVRDRAGARRRRSTSSTRRPRPTSRSAPGDRGKSIFLGLLYGAVGTAIAMGVALYRYRRLRFPDVWSYPGRPAELGHHRDHRRGRVPRRRARRAPPDRARHDRRERHPGDVYALATRLGAPGRNRWLLVMALGIGLAGGWVTGGHGRDRGRVPRPRHHPLRGVPLHRPRRPVPATRPRGRGDRGQKRRPPKGWHVIGPREPASRDR